MRPGARWRAAWRMRSRIPLTPIQLSAERMQRKFHASMNPEDAQLLQRSTDTIVQQVETMKQMVNAFSEYARAPDMKVTGFSLNELVTEVVELYRSPDSRVQIRAGSRSAAGNHRGGPWPRAPDPE